VSQIPENILRRSAEARAKKEGRPVDEILAEMKGEAPPAPSESSPSSDSSPSSQIPPLQVEVPPAVGAGQASTAPSSSSDTPAGAASAVSGPALLSAVAKARKMPESLVERSAKARSRSAGGSIDDVLLEWAEEEGIDISAMADPSPASDSTPTADGGGHESTAPPPGSESVAPVAAPAATSTAVAVVDEEVVIENDTEAEGEPGSNGAKSDRLLTVIRAGEVQRIRSAPTDRVTVWPHLLAIEFVALLVVLTLLITLSIFLDAPLLEFANFNEQPNPSKAPWYFLGLQELLAYFDPQVAGIIIPTFGAIAIAIIPYIDKNPSVKPSHRKLAIMIFTFFIMAAAVLTIFGSFFRGPGFNFTFPWEDGIFFDDLKSLLE
jgi:menaquinol-cytochrome c reductase cytochrome b/c subunit